MIYLSFLAVFLNEQNGIHDSMQARDGWRRNQQVITGLRAIHQHSKDHKNYELIDLKGVHKIRLRHKMESF